MLQGLRDRHVLAMPGGLRPAHASVLLALRARLLLQSHRTLLQLPRILMATASLAMSLSVLV